MGEEGRGGRPGVRGRGGAGEVTGEGKRKRGEVTGDGEGSQRWGGGEKDEGGGGERATFGQRNSAAMNFTITNKNFITRLQRMRGAVIKYSARNVTQK